MASGGYGMLWLSLCQQTYKLVIIWVWVNTYRYIFNGMNIHLPAILGFTRYQGFDPSPFHGSLSQNGGPNFQTQPQWNSERESGADRTGVEWFFWNFLSSLSSRSPRWFKWWSEKREYNLVGGLNPTPLKNDENMSSSQLGWWHSIPNCFWKNPLKSIKPPESINPNCFWKVIKFHGSRHHQPAIRAAGTQPVPWTPMFTRPSGP